MVLYLAPVSVVEDWAKTDPDTRKIAEQKMQHEWRIWMEAHAQMHKLTAAAGKTKQVTIDGISDTKNDIMMYSLVEADSHDAVTSLFADHPHLQIPQSSIEVMEVRLMES